MYVLKYMCWHSFQTCSTASDPDRLSGLKAWNANNPATWKCSVWAVDTPLQTFLACRSMDPPPSEFALRLLPNQPHTNDS